METAKRFSASEIVTYRLSNSTKIVHFDTLEEAARHVAKEADLHPRSKKFNAFIRDNEEKKSIHYIDAMRLVQSK